MKHDKTLLRKRFSRNLKTYDTLASVQRDIAGRIGSILADRVSSAAVARGAEIGAGTGFLTRHLVRLFPQAEWTVNDLVPESRGYLPSTTPSGIPLRFSAGDGEVFPFENGRFDLIASASTVQWFDDLPGFIARAADSLSENGILALSTFGPENFREITAATGQGLEYYPLGRLANLITDNGLRILAKEEWIEQQRYPTPTDVLRHLRLTGVNAVAAERWTHSRLKKFEEEYRAACAVAETGGDAGAVNFPPGKSGECVTLTFHPIILIAEKHSKP